MDCPGHASRLVSCCVLCCSFRALEVKTAPSSARAAAPGVGALRPGGRPVRAACPRPAAPPARAVTWGAAATAPVAPERAGQRRAASRAAVARGARLDTSAPAVLADEAAGAALRLGAARVVPARAGPPGRREPVG